MAQSIEELLHRRTDLSTFLVHFTRDGEFSARDNLIRMLQSGYIEARNPFGMGKNTATSDTRFQASQNVVCFSETPIEHAWMMCSEIEGRENGFGPYGLAFTKFWARSHHVNPVWYIDISARDGREWLTTPIDRLRDNAATEALRTTKSLADFDIARILPFFEQMGPITGSRKEWWWEREWRHTGHFQFAWTDVVAILAPYEEHASIRTSMETLAQESYPRPPLLDPNWGLERMISSLRGMSPEQMGPLA